MNGRLCSAFLKYGRTVLSCDRRDEHTEHFAEYDGKLIIWANNTLKMTADPMWREILLSPDDSPSEVICTQ